MNTSRLYPQYTDILKINCREVARLFGDGATYDAIENYLRKPKKQASALKEAASGREAPSVTSSRSKKAKTIADSPTKTRKSLNV